jgi:hypothetical protein
MDIFQAPHVQTRTWHTIQQMSCNTHKAKAILEKGHVLLPFPSSGIPLGQISKQYTATVVQRTSTKLAGKQI